MAAPKSPVFTVGSFIALAGVTYCYRADILPDVMLPLIVGGFAALIARGVSYLSGVQTQMETTLTDRETDTTELLEGFSSSLREVMELTADQLEAVQTNLQAFVKTMDQSMAATATSMEQSLSKTAKSMEQSLTTTATSLDERLTTNRKELAGSLDSIGKQLSFSSSGWGAALDKIFKAQQEGESAALVARDKSVKEWQTSLKTQLDDHAKQLKVLVGELSSDSKSNGEQMQKALSGATTEMGKSVNGWQTAVKTVLDSHATRMEAVSSQLAGQSESGGEELRASMITASDQLKGSLQTSAKEMGASMTSAARDLGAKVDAINQIASNIDQVLHVSTATNAALSSLTTAGEFKETLDAFRAHLDETQRVLKDVVKPKQFHLVENFGEGLIEEEG